MKSNRSWIDVPELSLSKGEPRTEMPVDAEPNRSVLS